MPGSNVLRATYSSLVSNTTVEGVIYSVQLDDTVVDCRCASTHGLANIGLCSYLTFASSWSSSGVLAGWVGSVSGCCRAPEHLVLYHRVGSAVGSRVHGKCTVIALQVVWSACRIEE